jgi:hypothetical protein
VNGREPLPGTACVTVVSTPRRTKFALRAGIVALSFARAAGAQQAVPPLDLTWNAPAECPSRRAVIDEVARLLSVASDPPVSAAVRADVMRDETGRWRATLRVETRDAHGDRTLDAENCEAIASATALIVAVAVEGAAPAQIERPAAVASPPEAAAPHALPPAPTPAAPSRPSPAAPPRSNFMASTAGVVDDATLPALAAGFEVTLGWVYGWSTWRARAMITGSSFPGQQTITVTDPSGEGGSFFTLLAGSGRACASYARGRFDVGPCLGGEIDTMRATGVGAGATFKSFQASGTWGSALGSVIGSWSFARSVALFAHADGLVPLAPPTFVLVRQPSNAHTFVYRPSVAMRIAVGVEMRFF